jgi:hypothetical protein
MIFLMALVILTLAEMNSSDFLGFRVLGFGP